MFSHDSLILAESLLTDGDLFLLSVSSLVCGTIRNQSLRQEQILPLIVVDGFIV